MPKEIIEAHLFRQLVAVRRGESDLTMRDKLEVYKKIPAGVKGDRLIEEADQVAVKLDSLAL